MFKTLYGSASGIDYVSPYVHNTSSPTRVQPLSMRLALPHVLVDMYQETAYATSITYSTRTDNLPLLVLNLNAKLLLNAIPPTNLITGRECVWRQCLGVSLS